jgi:small GTP-binding protein
MSEIFLKLLLIGDSYVGKTSLLQKYTEDEMPEIHCATIGVEFKEKTVTVNNREIKLQIWDTSGQERFRSITQNFFRNADGIAVVFDVTNKTTFDHVKNWLSDIQAIDSNIKIILVGNKIDLEDQRVIDTKRLEEYAKKQKLPFYETSAKTGAKVELIFISLAKLLLDNKTDEEINEQFAKISSNLSVSSGEEVKIKEKKNKCCS